MAARLHLLAHNEHAQSALYAARIAISPLSINVHSVRVVYAITAFWLSIVPRGAILSRISIVPLRRYTLHTAPYTWFTTVTTRCPPYLHTCTPAVRALTSFCKSDIARAAYARSAAPARLRCWSVSAHSAHRRGISVLLEQQRAGSASTALC